MKKILVPTDYSTCAQAALLHAFRLAQHYHAELHVLHVVEGDEESQNGVLPRKDTHIRGTEIDDSWGDSIAESPDRWNEVPIHRVTQVDSEPTHAILAYANEHGVDLIILGAHGDSGANRFLICGLDYLLIGTTAEQIVRMASCPVLTVGLRRGRYPSLVKRILMPVDLAAPDESSIVYARELAAIYEAELNLLNVIESSNGKLQRDSVEWQDLEAQAKKHLSDVFESAGGPDVSVRFNIVTGRPSREISAFAERQDIQLIVLSSHGMASTAHGPLQNENEPIIQMASYSVLTTRASQQASPLLMGITEVARHFEETGGTRIPLVNTHEKRRETEIPIRSQSI